MTPSDATEFLSVLSRRDGVLRSIDADVIGKRELVDRVDASRSTVDRSVRELEQAGLVERIDGGYRRTLAGELALREYDAFTSRIESLAATTDLLGALSPDSDVDAALFDGGDVVRAERHSPQAPVTALCDLVESADRVRSLCPAVFPRVIDAYVDGVERGMTAKLVFAPAAAERVVSAYSADLSAALDTGRLTVRQSPTDPPFGVVVAETDGIPVAGVLLFDEQGATAFVRNDDEEAVAWARRRLDTAWENATALPTPSD